MQDSAPPAKFVVWRDPATGDETVEVHPYMLVVPSEKETPTFMAIQNLSDTPITVDVWVDFGGVLLPPQTTGIINPNETGDFTYIEDAPDLPPGSYIVTFYIGVYDQHVYDSFTEPVIKVVEKIVEANLLDLVPPIVVYRGQKTQCTLVLDVKNIIRGKREVGDIWTIRDPDKLTDEIMGAGLTIVDDRVWQLMEEHLIGLTKTPPLTAGTQYPLTHEFGIPSDMPFGDSSFETYFGKWGEYFLLNDLYSGQKFTVDVQESSFISWMDMKKENMTIDAVIAIVEAFLGRRDLGFKPSLDELIEVVRYYKER